MAYRGWRSFVIRGVTRRSAWASIEAVAATTRLERVAAAFEPLLDQRPDRRGVYAAEMLGTYSGPTLVRVTGTQADNQLSVCEHRDVGVVRREEELTAMLGSSDGRNHAV